MEGVSHRGIVEDAQEWIDMWNGKIVCKAADRITVRQFFV